MTTTVPAVQPGDRRFADPQSPRHGRLERRPAAQRGRVVVANRVIEKIASQTAAEIAGTAGRGGGFLGIGAHADASARPKVTAEVAGRTATLRVELGVGFPAPIAALALRVQQELTRNVERLSGVTVTRVDVDVVALVVDGTAAASSGRTAAGRGGRVLA
ncbi:Asp23/Gls24 family envelope stress response protein [Microlunatus soli]|uniref:Uncharacterized conserved protein YloU, alkaline shock protein (Asp23) family n=1 Tax=Microlunatus soli TaxID=630515 RepID=A0A1H1XE63_9ACTN|nr:Asp23/Gls24 family envelope stress response protein [Microlunatus soli]SDT07462.1 Uncharacterized conserved protein YloU, alkaline shock protein (Asp23) family [Microlunatus soli]